MTHERLLQALHYDKRTGLFTWLVTIGSKKKDSIAGSIRKVDGRVCIGLDGESFLASRLAWFYVKGEWPKGDIDHRDTDPTNDRWTNLRDVPHSINQQNFRKAYSNSKTGVLGVSPDGRGGFKAQIGVSGKTKLIGRFKTIAKASNAYLAARRELHAGNTL